MQPLHAVDRPTPAIVAGPASISVTGTRVNLVDLVVDDADLATLLSRSAQAEWPEVVRRAISVGAKGMISMGLGLDLATVEDSVGRVASSMESTVGEVMRTLTEHLAERLDPGRASSVSHQFLSDVQNLHRDLVAEIDPANPTSHTRSLITALEGFAAPGGPLERRLGEILDADSDASALSRVRDTLSGEISRLRDEVLAGRSRDEGRAAEARVGTRQGFDFEDQVEGWLRAAARSLPGCIVERTSHQPGALGSDCMAGDFVVTLETGERILLEAKNTGSISLRGRGGILDELDRAKANRSANVAICISARHSFPTEVGAFWANGDRLLVVDDGDDGTMTEVALRWAVAALGAARSAPGTVDAVAIQDALDRIKDLATHLSRMKRTTGEIGKQVTRLREELVDMRLQLLEQVAAAERVVQAD